MPDDEQIGETAAHRQTLRVLRQPAIAHLGKAEHTLDYQKRMLDFGAHLGLRAVLAVLHFIYDAAMAVAPVGEVLGVRRVIADHVFLPSIGLIAIHPRLVAVQQPAKQLCVMHVCCGGLHRVDQLGLAVHPDVQLHPEIPLLTLPRLVHLRSRALASFLVELGAAMIVASTMVPPATFRPREARCSFTRSNSGLPRSWRSSRWRKLRIVVSSGTGSRPRSMPTNRRIDSESYSASSAAGSDRLNQCCRKCSRSIRSRPIGGRPLPALG